MLKCFRVFSLVVLSFSVLFSVAAVAKGKVRTTSNPNDTGWYEVSGKLTAHQKILPVIWKDVKSSCEPCKYLVQEYNLSMRELMRYRHRAKLYREDRAMREDYYVELHKDKSHIPEGRELGAAALHLGEILERAPHDARSEKRAISNIKAAESRAQKLREKLADCEKQCKSSKTTKIKIGGRPVITGAEPKDSGPLYEYTAPKWWKGPFDDVCFECAKLAKELNERIPHEIKIREIELEHLKRLEKKWSFDLDERSRMSELKSELDNLEYHYDKTLKMYNDCIKTCKPKKTACVFPDKSGESISIGANSEFGTGAAMKEKAKGKAKGMAMGALNSALGGSGISFGGGSKSKEPKIQKDPTKGAFKDFVSKGNGIEHVAGVEAGGRFILVGDNELVASVKLKDVPGDGTFHAMWLEDGEGNIILPKEYMLFSLYQDWKLTVWWSYDHWTNGVHDKHDEGEEVSFGRNELGSFAVWVEGAKNAIWSGFGFATAVKGVKHMGAKFPVSPAMLNDPCGLRLVTHVSLPKKDPVVTQAITMNVPSYDELSSKAIKSKSKAKKAPRSRSVND